MIYPFTYFNFRTHKSFPLNAVVGNSLYHHCSFPGQSWSLLASNCLSNLSFPFIALNTFSSIFI